MDLNRGILLAIVILLVLALIVDTGDSIIYRLVILLSIASTLLTIQRTSMMSSAPSCSTEDMTSLAPAPIHTLPQVAAAADARPIDERFWSGEHLSRYHDELGSSADNAAIRDSIWRSTVQKRQQMRGMRMNTPTIMDMVGDELCEQITPWWADYKNVY